MHWRLVLSLGLGLSLPAPDAKAADRPNILLIVADDLGYADVGFGGAKVIPTPHLDRLAAAGVRFTQGYVSHPFCSPSRAGLLTGRYQQRFGHEYNPRYDPRDERSGLPTDQVTLADVLRQAGYVTGAVGKWHLGAVPRFHPNARGFVEYFGFIGGSHNYQPGLPGSGQYVIPLLRNGEAVDEREYLTDAFAREAARFIERHRGEPFFLYLPFNAPHGPFQAPPSKYLNRLAGVRDRQRRIYYGMVSALDDSVGRVLATLRETGLERRTIVFFLSDNGGRREAVVSSNGALRGYKEQLFEGGIRVPFLMSWPGVLAPGQAYDKPVIALDVFATAVSAAGARPPTDRKLDGVDLLPYLLGRKRGPPHERLFWRTGGGRAYAVREGDYKLVKEKSESPLLFDLARDPGETRDRAEEQPGIVRQLARAYEAWNAELIPPVFADGEAPVPAPEPPIEKHLVFLDYPGFPEAHSSWGSIGYSTRYDKVFVGVTNHRDKIGLYEYDVPTRKLRLLGFVADMANLRREQWQGKIHSYLVEGPDGNIYFSTDGGEDRQEYLMDHPHGYGGGSFFRWEPAAGRLTDLGKALPFDSLKNVAVDDVTGLLYGVSYPQAHLLVYDPRRNDLQDLGRLTSAYVPRVLFTDWWGNAYYVDWRQRLVKYERESARLVFARDPLPSFEGTPGWFVMSGITAVARDRGAGIIHLMTYGSRLFAFHPAREGIGEVEDLGRIYDGAKPAWDYWCRNLSRGRNGKLYYFVGGHDRYPEPGDKVVMMEFDPRTRLKRRLHTFGFDRLLEVPGSGVTDKDGNIYFAARRADPKALAAGDSGSSVPFLMIFNPDRALR